MARQPEVAGNIQTAMIIAAALIEGVTFFALIVCLSARRDSLRPIVQRLAGATFEKRFLAVLVSGYRGMIMVTRLTAVAVLTCGGAACALPRLLWLPRSGGGGADALNPVNADGVQLSAAT